MKTIRGRHIAFITAALGWLFYLFTGELYLFTDNVDVAIVLNGYYANPLSLYQHPILCLLIFGLSRIFQSADMFTVSVHFLIFCELSSLMLLLPKRVMEKWIREWQLPDVLVFMTSVLFCVFLSAGLNLWRANYTVTAASFLFTGWLILSMGRNRENRQFWTVVGTVFVALGYMLRKEAGLLFFPFIGLLLVAELVSGHKADVVRRYLPACIAVLLLVISQTVFDSIEPYATAKQYNTARTAMVDFPVKTWNEASSDINREDYVAATNWLFSDTEVMGAETLSEMAKKSERNAYEFSAEGLRGALRNMLRIANRTDVYMTVMVILCLMLSVWNAFSQSSGWHKLIAICAIIGAFVILLYYTFRGRALLRVWQPVLFAVLLLETALIIIGGTKLSGSAQTVFLLLVTGLLYYSAGQVIAHTEFHSPHTALTARTGADDSAYEQTLHDDDLYIWPIWHAEILKYFGEMGKLPT